MNGMTSATAAVSFLTDNALQGPGKKDPRQVAGSFESLFYRMMLRQMREGSLAEGLFDSAAMKQVRGMLDDELASRMGAMGHLGIADMVMQTIEKQQGSVAAEIATGLLK